MTKAFIANTHYPVELPLAALGRLGRFFVDVVVNAWTPPDVGEPPLGFFVSRRGWKRNSALVLSLYEHDRR